MFKKIAIVIVAAIAGVLIFASTRPDTFRIERSAAIAAPPEKIFPLINDFTQWAKWSPFETMDPDMKRTISGPPSGVGAVYEWSGNMKAGAGRMEIVESSAPAHVVIKLDFTKPMEGHNVAHFVLTPEPGATNVAWSIDGPMPYISKVMGVFMNMDKMIGGDFDKGLAALKAQAEKTN
jgi:uncharacterized protein YndB with AHSA1/START domain